MAVNEVIGFQVLGKFDERCKGEGGLGAKGKTLHTGFALFAAHHGQIHGSERDTNRFGDAFAHPIQICLARTIVQWCDEIGLTGGGNYQENESGKPRCETPHRNTSLAAIERRPVKGLVSKNPA
jgi:hypothetical protein